MFAARWRRALPLGAASILIVALAAGCGGGRAQQTTFEDANPLPDEPLQVDVTGQHGGRMVYVTIGDPKTFNPVIANETSSTDITSGPLFAGIIEFNNATQEIQPGLAKEWEVSEDGLTWTFRFRRGVRWSDGHPFSVDDVLFTSQVVYDDKVQASVRSLLMVDGKPWKWTKIDSLTLQIELPAAFGSVLEVIGSMYLVPKHKLEAAYLAGRYEQMWGIDVKPDSVVTLGPFTLEQYRSSESTTLRRNPHYWKVDRDGKRLPYLDRFVFISVPDFNATFLKFTTGESHILDPVRPEDAALISDDQKKGDYTIYDLGPDVATNFMWFNLNPGKGANGKPYVIPYKRAWFEDVRFRRAVSHAVDREGMVRAVFQGRGNPQYEPMTIANKKWYNPNVPKFQYDPAKSKALLDEMGLVDRNGDGVREDAQGRKVEFVLYTNSENTVRKGLGTIVRENLAAVGINCIFQPIEFNTIISHIRSDYEYESILLGLTGGVPPDPALSRNVWLSSGVTHQWHPEQKSPTRPWEAEIDRLMDVVVKEHEFPARKAAFDRVQEIVGEQQPMIYLARENLNLAVSNKYKNIRPSVLRPHVLWNLDQIYFAPAGAVASR